MERKSLNKNLHKANQAKKDEFYTQLVDIETLAITQQFSTACGGWFF